jgi:hypothetical protein
MPGFDVRCIAYGIMIRFWRECRALDTGDTPPSLDQIIMTYLTAHLNNLLESQVHMPQPWVRLAIAKIRAGGQ